MPALIITQISSLYWLTEGALEDHRLFLHYSGHGSQAETDSPSEPDHFDESEQFVETPRAGPHADIADL